MLELTFKDSGCVTEIIRRATFIFDLRSRARQWGDNEVLGLGGPPSLTIGLLSEGLGGERSNESVQDHQAARGWNLRLGSQGCKPPDRGGGGNQEDEKEILHVGGMYVASGGEGAFGTRLRDGFRSNLTFSGPTVLMVAQFNVCSPSRSSTIPM